MSNPVEHVWLLYVEFDDNEWVLMDVYASRELAEAARARYASDPDPDERRSMDGMRIEAMRLRYEVN